MGAWSGAGGEGGVGKIRAGGGWCPGLRGAGTGGAGVGERVGRSWGDRDRGGVDVEAGGGMRGAWAVWKARAGVVSCRGRVC